MTLAKFQKQLKKVNPKLTVRQRGFGDIGGIFGDGKYIARITKGELNMRGYRHRVINKDNPTQYIDGNIKKRGRVTLVNLLRNYRWIKNHKQKSMLLWGIE